MSRARAEAFRNLRLDGSFFQRLLQREQINLPHDAMEQDFDLYLMEKGVMPVILQGLDALSRHVDKMNNKAELCGGPSGGARPAFNPLTWLAQYLLRNHPSHVKDHRTPMYQQFSELADVERGRRCLLRRRAEFEEEWYEMEKEGDRNCLPLQELPILIQHLDDKWNLGGAFSQQMPQDYSSLLVPGHLQLGVNFVDFWAWFESFVWQNDLLRASAFEEAQERLRQAEVEAQRNHAEELKRERAKNEAIQTRTAMQEQFEAASADMYINSEISQILHKGAYLDIDDREGSVPFKGEHVDLIITMLKLWGFNLDDSRSVASEADDDAGPALEAAEDQQGEAEETTLLAAEPLVGKELSTAGGAAFSRQASKELLAEPGGAAVSRQATFVRQSSMASTKSAGGTRHYVWNSRAQDTWECWCQMQGPGTVLVDNAGIRALMDMQAFEEHLVRAFPMRVGSSGDAEAPRVVEVQAIVDDGEGGRLVEVVERDTGAVQRLAAPDTQVEELRLRLAEWEGGAAAQPGPVLAQVDAATNRIMEVLPPGGTSS